MALRPDFHFTGGTGVQVLGECPLVGSVHTSRYAPLSFLGFNQFRVAVTVEGPTILIRCKSVSRLMGSLQMWQTNSRSTRSTMAASNVQTGEGEKFIMRREGCQGLTGMVSIRQSAVVASVLVPAAGTCA